MFIIVTNWKSKENNNSGGRQENSCHSLRLCHWEWWGWEKYTSTWNDIFVFEIINKGKARLFLIHAKLRSIMACRWQCNDDDYVFQTKMAQNLISICKAPVNTFYCVQGQDFNSEREHSMPFLCRLMSFIFTTTHSGIYNHL